jgi:hypothetical protein
MYYIMLQFRHLHLEIKPGRCMYLKKIISPQPTHCVRLVFALLLPGETCDNFIKDTPNMSRVKDHEDPKVNKAVKLILANPNLTVPEALRAAKFTIEESQSAKMQMLIRRRLPKGPPKNINVEASPGNATLSISTLTTTTPVAI